MEKIALSKTMLIVFFAAAIGLSALVSAAVTMNFAVGPQGPTGPQGPSQRHANWRNLR